MQHLIERILSKSRKSWLRNKPLYVRFRPVEATELDVLQEDIRTPLEPQLRLWLLAAGYGDLADRLSFRREWFRVIDRGQLAGTVLFAQDELGNFYGFVPGEGRIIFLERRTGYFAVLSPGFFAFIEELERRDFRLTEWTNDAQLHRCG